MNSTEFCSTIDKVYGYFAKVIKYGIMTEAEYKKHYHYTTAEYESDLKKILAFNGNLWDKKFWGLGVSDSICAIATQPAQQLRIVKEYYREQI